jgi:hypothetical protein
MRYDIARSVLSVIQTVRRLVCGHSGAHTHTETNDELTPFPEGSCRATADLTGANITNE